MDGVDGNPTEVPQGTQPSVTPQPTPKQDANKGISRPASLRSARSVVGSSSCASALSRAAPSLISRLSAPATGRTTATATSTSPSFSDGFGQGPTSKESALCATLNTTGGNIASLDLANSGPSGQLQGNSRYDAESSSASPMSRVSFSEDTAVLGGSIAGTSGNWISGWSSSTQTVNEDDEEPDDGERGIEAGSHQEDGTDAGGRRQSIGLESGPGSALALLRDVSTRSSSRVTTFSSFPSSKANGKQREVEEEDIVTLAQDQDLEANVERTYFVFTTAGKPVYISRRLTLPGGLLDGKGQRRRANTFEREREAGMQDEEEESATTRIGVMTALISIFTDEGGDRLREIVSDLGRITFLQRSPLLFAGVTKSRKPEPSFVMRSHLDLLHNQVLGLLSTGQLNAMFKRKASVDLRRLLEGTDPILTALLERAQWDRSLTMSALQPCRLPLTLRDELSQLLDPGRLPEGRRPPDLLYVLLLSGSDIVTLLRPRKHSVHPIDMQLLINTVQGTPALREAGSESWLPLSLPKFAPQGFVHVYASVLDLKGSHSGQSEYVNSQAALDAAPETLTLCFVTGNREAFPLLRQWRSEFFNRISKASFADRLIPALFGSRYLAEQVGVTGVRHFFYKSRINTQITSPILDSTYAKGTKDLHRLLGLYDHAFQAIHGIGHVSRSSQVEQAVGLTLAPPPLKMHYIKTTQEAVLAWITQPFELYLTVSPWLPKSAVIAAANAVAKWVKKQENSLFLLSPPVF